ncbi:MAG: paraquat-inducible protein A [Pseudomonadota bacterium]
MSEPPIHPRSLAATADGPDRVLGWAIVANILLLILGWMLPIMTVERLIFLSERFSILEGIGQLWANGNYALFVLIAVFSILFPLGKLILALFLWYLVDASSANLARSLRWMEALGRWSMLDVFVIAFIVAAIQVSFIDDVELHAGIYVFAAAVLLSIFLVQRMTALARRAVARAG